MSKKQQTQQARIETLEHLVMADEGSFYTIIGAGGDLQEWVDGYNQWLAEEEIGRPIKWFMTTGQQVNEYARPSNRDDMFPADLTFLLFPLDGLHVGKLAIFKLTHQDRWFDDVVANMRG